jgi:uncharacterized membrane protein
MSKSTVQTEISINNTPEAVIAYVADVNNRPLFLASLKSVSDIEGEPLAVGTTWRWKWDMLGAEFEGSGRCLAHDPGQRYSFTTEGGISSTFTYEATATDAGTSLTIRVEFEAPDSLLSRMGVDSLLESLKQGDAEKAAQNLKVILDT